MNIQDLNRSFRRHFNFDVPLDMLMIAHHGPKHAVIDVIKLDEKLGQNDHEYDPDKCTYKDQKDISMGEYIILKYGQEAADLVKANIS